MSTGPSYGLVLIGKRSDDFVLNLEKRPPAVTVTFRLLGPDALKLDALAAALQKRNPRAGKIGRSKMARLIVEKFIAEHAPGSDAGAKREK